MPITKVKNRFPPVSRRGLSKFTLGVNGLNDEQIVELLDAYQTMGKLIERLVGRERLYHPQFLAGLESALKEVAAGRTREVKNFEDFAS